MKTKLTGILLLLILITACKTEKKEAKTPNEFTNINIELVDNNKWPVDKPMMAHIQNIKKDVVQFDGVTLEDYTKLSKKIDAHLDLLTSNCTMTGQGHDELHKWLLPFLEVTTNFSNSKTVEEAQETYLVINHSFKLVDVNFK